MVQQERNNNPAVTVLGVYRIQVTEELVRFQTQTLYGYLTGEEWAQAESNCREQLASVVLIEVLITEAGSNYDASDFGQSGSDQAAWLDTYLTTDGSDVLPSSFEHSATGDFRVAFFLHFYDPSKPLNTSYGLVICPKPQEMPDRLKRLVPYEPVD